jgi:beta-lactam-binding protein with PASTA domain
MEEHVAHDVLISYSTLDKLQADAICNRLESQGIRCWIAPRDVPAGSEYAESIVQAIEAAQVMVLIYSAHAEGSKQVRREVERAVHHGITIMPVRIEAAEMSPAFEYYVASLHWLDAINPPLEQHIDKLATDLRAVLDKRAQGGASGSGGPRSRPIPLVARDDNDAGRHGRDQGDRPDDRSAASHGSALPSPQATPSRSATPLPASPPATGNSTGGGSRTGILVGAGVAAALLLGVVGYNIGKAEPDPTPTPTPVPTPGPSPSSPVTPTPVALNPDALVPAVTDKNRRDAIGALEAVGLKVRVVEEEHADLRFPKVIRTEPAAGLKTPAGEVTLVVSGMRDVPSVIDQPLASARKLLTERGFATIEVKEVAGAKPEGTVVGMVPGGGMAHFKGKPVILEVVGAKPALPDVVKRKATDAEKLLKEARYAVKIERDWVAGAETDSVVSMAPPAGTKLSPGDTVTLTVAANGGWVWAPVAAKLATNKEFRMPTAGNLRSEPKSGGKTIGVLRAGQTARVLESYGDGWVKIVQVD